MLAHPTRFVCVLAAWLAAGGSCAQSALIDVVVNRTSGQVTLVNPGAIAAPIAGYSIGSASGSLLPGNWISIADNYDADSGGLVDPNDNWIIISSAVNSLAEGDFNGDGGAISPGLSVPLGAIWNPFGAQDLDVLISTPQVSQPNIEYRLVGDYNGDGVVNAADYTVWRDTLGRQSLLNRDPDVPGAVGEQDYLVWRSLFGSALGSAVGASAAVAIPEPTFLTLLALLLAAWAAISVRARTVRREFPAPPRRPLALPRARTAS